MTDEEAAAVVKNWCIRNERKKNRDNQGQSKLLTYPEIKSMMRAEKK